MMHVELAQTNFNNERQVFSFDILVNGRKVGFAQLRLKSSKSGNMPDGFESHVYYEVDEKYRGKGIATAALQEIKKVAANHGLDELILTANTNNAASLRVIEKCSGKLVDESKTEAGTEVRKFLIKI